MVDLDKIFSGSPEKIWQRCRGFTPSANVLRRRQEFKHENKTNNLTKFKMDHNIGEKIAVLCIKQFHSLPKTGKPKENEWTILSCIVKEQDSILEVVSLGTGSKCIGKSKMCPKGTIINDSHAEIMCRRAFLSYLYSQLKHNSMILIFDQQHNTFLLKPNVRFHFFTTHVPCGDAAIFTKEQSEDFGEVIKAENIEFEIPLKKRKIDEIFRTGAKCLKEDVIQDLKAKDNITQVTGAVRLKPGNRIPLLFFIET